MTCARRSTGEERAAIKLLELCRDELDTSTFYDYHVMSRMMKVSPGAIDDVIEKLRSMDYRASRVHYIGTGLKTDAPMSAIKEAMT